jgi:hypothetical protein
MAEITKCKQISQAVFRVETDDVPVERSSSRGGDGETEGKR